MSEQSRRLSEELDRILREKQSGIVDLIKRAVQVGVHVDIMVATATRYDEKRGWQYLEECVGFPRGSSDLLSVVVGPERGVPYTIDEYYHPDHLVIEYESL